MNLKLGLIFITLIFFLKNHLCCQIKTDTIVNHKKYTFKGYYPSRNQRENQLSDEKPILLYIGNYENGLKTGNWIYFNQKGETFAQGSYSKGKKIKKWKYYSSSGSCRILDYS